MAVVVAVARMERSVIRGRSNQKQRRSRITLSLPSGPAEGRTRWLHPGYRQSPLLLLPRLQESGECLQRYLRDVMLDTLGVGFGGFSRPPHPPHTVTPHPVP